MVDSIIQPDTVLPSPPKAMQGRLSVSVSISNTRCQEKPRLKFTFRPWSASRLAVVTWIRWYTCEQCLFGNRTLKFCTFFSRKNLGGRVKGLTMAGRLTCLVNPRWIGLFDQKSAHSTLNLNLGCRLLFGGGICLTKRNATVLVASSVHLCHDEKALWPQHRKFQLGWAWTG